MESFKNYLIEAHDAQNAAMSVMKKMIKAKPDVEAILREALDEEIVARIMEEVLAVSENTVIATATTTAVSSAVELPNAAQFITSELLTAADPYSPSLAKSTDSSITTPQVSAIAVVAAADPSAADLSAAINRCSSGSSTALSAAAAVPSSSSGYARPTRQKATNVSSTSDPSPFVSNNDAVSVALDQHPAGTKKFMGVFEKIEQTYFGGHVDIREMEDGNEWKEEDKEGGLELTKPIHFKKTDGLGMKKVNANLENIESLGLGDENGNLDVILGYQAGRTVSMPVTELSAALKDPILSKRGPLNCLSLEISNNPTIDGQFGVPDFVEKNSMIRKLKKVLEKKLDAMEDQATAAGIEEEKEELETKVQKIQRQIKLLPRVEKFLLLTTRGALTDIHVDFSATSVFYTVLEGEKIFWIAENSEENLDLYKKYELRSGEKGSEADPWLGCLMKDKMMRITIKAGEAVMIPAGYPHFVFTPVNSVVMGGNFLREESAALQFELTRLEEECLARAQIGRANMVQGFSEAMFAYTEHILLPRMKEGPLGSETRTLAEVFLKDLSRDCRLGNYVEIRGQPEQLWEPVYERTEREKLVDELRQLLDAAPSSSPSSSSISNDAPTVSRKRSSPESVSVAPPAKRLAAEQSDELRTDQFEATPSSSSISSSSSSSIFNDTPIVSRKRSSSVPSSVAPPVKRHVTEESEELSDDQIDAALSGSASQSITNGAQKSRKRGAAEPSSLAPPAKRNNTSVADEQIHEEPELNAAASSSETAPEDATTEENEDEPRPVSSLSVMCNATTPPSIDQFVTPVVVIPPLSPAALAAFTAQTPSPAPMSTQVSAHPPAAAPALRTRGSRKRASVEASNCVAKRTRSQVYVDSLAVSTRTRSAVAGSRAAPSAPISRRTAASRSRAGVAGVSTASAAPAAPAGSRAAPSAPTSRRTAAPRNRAVAPAAPAGSRAASSAPTSRRTAAPRRRAVASAVPAAPAASAGSRAASSASISRRTAAPRSRAVAPAAPAVPAVPVAPAAPLPTAVASAARRCSQPADNTASSALPAAVRSVLYARSARKIVKYTK